MRFKLVLLLLISPLIIIFSNPPIKSCLELEYEGKTYKTILIGKQCWMVENIDIGLMINKNKPNDHQTDNNIIEKYCYNNKPLNCKKYGGLYQWDEAMKYTKEEGSQGICPEQWHIPTLSDFQELGSFVNASSNALKIKCEENKDDTGTNKSGFSVLLTGFGSAICDTAFKHEGNFANVFSSTESYTVYAYYFHLEKDNDNILYVNSWKSNGFSIRCLKD